MEMVVTRGSNPCIFPTLRLVEEVTAVQSVEDRYQDGYFLRQEVRHVW